MKGESGMTRVAGDKNLLGNDCKRNPLRGDRKLDTLFSALFEETTFRKEKNLFP